MGPVFSVAIGNWLELSIPIDAQDEARRLAALLRRLAALELSVLVDAQDKARWLAALLRCLHLGPLLVLLAQVRVGGSAGVGSGGEL
tara:strand:+ start:127 stop:387 length:261 start_codon:yes stop_codon:yes gene_type:complete